MENTLVKTEIPGLLAQRGNAQDIYSSWNPTDKKDKIAFFNAINSPENTLADCINTEIAIKHVYAETVTFIDEETGTATPGVRIVLITDKGKSYGCCSQGIRNSLSKIFAIMGEPSTWEEPVKVVVKQIKRGAKKNVLTLSLV